MYDFTGILGNAGGLPDPLQRRQAVMPQAPMGGLLSQQAYQMAGIPQQPAAPAPQPQQPAGMAPGFPGTSQIDPSILQWLMQGGLLGGY